MKLRTFFCLSLILFLCFNISCKKDIDTRGNSEPSYSLSAVSPSLSEEDIIHLREKLDEWYSDAESEAVLVKGFYEQTFLISKSKIFIMDDGNNISFAADPKQDSSGVFFIMPQNIWCNNIEQAINSIEESYKSGKGYKRSKYTSTSLGNIHSRYLR